MKKADDSLYRIKTQNANTGSLYYAKYTSAFVYKKTFDVPGEGENVRTVSLTYGGLKGAYNYNVIVEFIDDAAEPDLSLSGITVGGESISGFDANITEYNVEVESLDTEILGTAADSTAKVTLSKPSSLPGDATITVTKDGKSKVYTLHLTQKADQKNQIVFEKNPSNWSIAEDVKAQKTKVYSDSDIAFWDWGGLDLDGTTAIQPANSDATNATCTSKTQQTWASFTINNSADIYVMSRYAPGTDYMKWLTTDGYQQVTDKNGDPVKVLYSNSTSKNYNVYKKTVSVAPGEIKSIDLGILGPYGDGLMYSVLVQWKESGAEEALPGQVTNIQSAASMPNLIEGFGIGTKRWSNTGSTWDIHTWANLDGFTVNSANSYYLQCNFSDWDTDNFKQSKSEGWLSFDVNRSANIYVILATNGSGVGGASAYPGLNAANGWEKMTKADGTDLKITTASYVEGTSYGRTDTILRVGYVYKKNVTLPADGESVQNISLPYGGTYAYGNYGVVVEFTDSAE